MHVPLVRLTFRLSPQRALFGLKLHKQRSEHANIQKHASSIPNNIMMQMHGRLAPVHLAACPSPNRFHAKWIEFRIKYSSETFQLFKWLAFSRGWVCFGALFTKVHSYTATILWQFVLHVVLAQKWVLNIYFPSTFTSAVRGGQWLLHCKQRRRIRLRWLRCQQKDPHLGYRDKYNVIVKFVQDVTMYHATAWMFKLRRRDGGKCLLSMCHQRSLIEKVGTFRHMSLLNHNKLFCTLAHSALSKLNFCLPSNVLQPEASTTMDSARPWLKSCLHYTVTWGIQYEKVSQV